MKKLRQLGTNKIRSFEFQVFSTGLEFIHHIHRKTRRCKQINELISDCFPKFFSSRKVLSFSEQFKILINKRHILDENLQTFLILHGGRNVVAFAQIYKDPKDKKFKLINLCRDKRSKGMGTQLCIMIYQHLVENDITSLVYLNVSAENTKLIQYYEKLGWENTHSQHTPQTEDKKPTLELKYFIF